MKTEIGRNSQCANCRSYDDNTNAQQRCFVSRKTDLILRNERRTLEERSKAWNVRDSVRKRGKEESRQVVADDGGESFATSTATRRRKGDERGSRRRRRVAERA